MVYDLKQCPICGSFKLKQNSIKKNDSDEIIIYKCLSCDSIVSDENYNKNNTLSATNIFNRYLKTIIEITADYENESYSGTAILLKDNYAITNAHVLMKDDEMPNHIYGNFFKDIKTFELEIVSIDEDYDIALLSFSIMDYESAKLSLKEVKTGENIFAIGNAIGQGLTIVEGIVSDSNREVNGNYLIMHTAPVNHGNSGGPLLNSKGEIVGLVSSSRKDANSMSYAIASVDVMDFLNDILM